MKYVVFLGDGMGDDPQEKLGGKTIIEAAYTPNMDRIAREGACGMLQTVPEGMPPDSTVANLSVMGYDPRECLEGRGVLEAAAMGVELEPDDHAMRMNVICVRDGKILSHSAGNITTPEATQLVRALQEGLLRDGVIYYPGVSYRHVLRLTCPASKAVECAPPHDHLDETLESLLPRATAPEGEPTAALLRELILESNRILENHPVNIEREKKGLQKANYLWPWSIGRRPAMKSFRELFGLQGAVVCAVDLIRGIGAMAGMKAPRVEGATGLWDTNFEGKARAAIQSLDECDLVYIHVEAPDEAGHEGNMEIKIRAIEDIDRRLMGPVMDGIKGPVRFAVLTDHPTPIAIRTHVRRSVPFAIMGEGIKPDSVKTYGENSCMAGTYGELAGDAFMRLFTGR